MAATTNATAAFSETHRSLLLSMLQEPGARACRAVYADWLEERGAPLIVFAHAIPGYRPRFDRHGVHLPMDVPSGTPHGLLVLRHANALHHLSARRTKHTTTVRSWQVWLPGYADVELLTAADCRALPVRLPPCGTCKNRFGTDQSRTFRGGFWRCVTCEFPTPPIRQLPRR